jgi:hypothetical protein
LYIINHFLLFVHSIIIYFVDAISVGTAVSIFDNYFANFDALVIAIIEMIVINNNNGAKTKVAILN